MNTDTHFTDLLRAAVTEPGRIHAAYTAFHGYSFGNQLYALLQCVSREIPLGPIASFNRWKELGRRVRKGEKAIELCMPVTVKRTVPDPATGEDETVAYTRFVFRRNWFVLSQTEGDDYVPLTVPGWDADRALTTLQVTRAPFEHLDGNCQGYARERTVAINPVAAQPFRTLIHEMAHVILGHTAEAALTDGGEITPRDVRELEAEATAMLVSAALQQPGIEYSRGYIQHWYAGAEIPERTAQRIFKAADQILRAGEVV